MKLTREKIQRMIDNQPSSTSQPGGGGGAGEQGATAADWIHISDIIKNGNEFNFFDNENASQNQAIYINYKGHNGGNTGEAITDIYICNGQGGQTGVVLHVANMQMNGPITGVTDITLNGSITGVTDITLNGNSLVTTLQNLANAISNLGISDISGLSAVLQDFEDRIYALEHPTP